MGNKSMEPIKIITENKLPAEFWNRAYDIGRMMIGEDIGEMGRLGISLDEMRMRSDDHSCLCNEGSIIFIKKGEKFGDWVTTKHILRITEESGKDSFTIEIFEDHSDSELMYQEFGVARDKLRETVFREARNIKKMFFCL